MVVIAEYNKNTNSPTGTLYEINNCGELSEFNKNFNYKKYCGVVDNVKYYNMNTLTEAVKAING